MHKKLTAGAATGFLLLGASGVAMAQEEPPTFPPMVVFSVETTPELVVDVTAGDPCVEAVQTLRAVPLLLREINVIQETFLTFVFSSAGGAILVCAPEGTEPPEAPPPTEEPPPEEPPA
jgi:hypothetical protein